MSLDNLVKIGRLKPHSPARDEIADLLAAARRNLADSRAENISTENRFDAAYKCIMQAAMVTLMASGYRPDTKAAGHHLTVLQSLAKTIGVNAERVALLDALRHKRNQSDYTGKPVDTASLSSCIGEAERLLEDVGAWLSQNHPGLSS